jgi:two-component system, NtrC family, sensor kinase
MGRLVARARDPLTIERAAVETHGLDESELERRGIVATSNYIPFFDQGARGFDVPLTEGGRLLGVLSVEVPVGCALPAWDPPIVVPFALEMASKLKGARLYRESSYLRDYLSQVIERANAPIVVLRPNRTIEHVNRAFTTVTHSHREQWTGRDLLEILPDSERAVARGALRAAARGEAMTNVELRIPRTGGGTARIAFNTASILAPDGELAGIVAIGRDMTEVRDLEEQVIQAEKLATLGQLAAGVVHELNNPLTSISVYSDYLLTKGRKSGTETPDLEKLARISEAAARMLRFTRDLVSYARPSSEEPLHLSMTEVIDQALVFCEHVILDSHVQVTKSYEQPLPNLWAVRGQLHQVFINLITNACHAVAATSPMGNLRVEVASQNGFVVAALRDDGPGIAQEHLDHVFEPFFSTKGEGKGTGLGLSIVRNIVHQHGGTIDVETQCLVSHQPDAAHGTAFIVRLPVRARTAED